MTTILITGGTGSFGSAFTRYILSSTDHKVRIYSRDEYKQYVMASEIPPSARVTYILGDVRDMRQLVVALDGVDMVVHAAAIKQVATGERQTGELVKTNVTGTANVVEAAIECRVSRSLFLGTDKLVSALNAYGRSKAIAESLWINGNSRGTSRDCKFVAVRGGNVWMTRASVGQKWIEDKKNNQPITVTDPNSTRFHLEMPHWVGFCYRVLTEAHGGEVFVPKAKAWKLDDLAQAFNNLQDAHYMGPRDGDKQHEYLIALEEAHRVLDVGWAYIVQPPMDLRSVWNYTQWQGQDVPSGFSYSSASADRLSIEELREIWKKY